VGYPSIFNNWKSWYESSLALYIIKKLYGLLMLLFYRCWCYDCAKGLSPILR
jgi:hypothetical protein